MPDNFYLIRLSDPLVYQDVHSVFFIMDYTINTDIQFLAQQFIGHPKQAIFLRTSRDLLANPNHVKLVRVYRRNYYSQNPLSELVRIESINLHMESFRTYN